MKIVVSLFAFAMTLALTAPAMAEEGGHGGGGHGDLSAQMNALFPQPMSNPDKRKVPAVVELTGPAYNEAVTGGKAALAWKANPDANEYHVQVATDPNFKWLVANEYHVTDAKFEVSGLEAGKNYFWRVAPVRSGNWSTFRKGFFATSMFTAK
ncbi:fibronectin type III domain-containing protein [Bdellovibrio reynosensis]|uniref:Fibronectin type III domain-containing protein n=1 Tax=Bdellovibrio reynosensis TaxID=2835041 RepID=A0ABY4C6V2_9BACT|nr:fibronectin type III domain-containing protein [Bdellovibrio reynosensis]UOF00696.1 fibronectin type III domain-containing protein [Bdellovibrio reynosensis]